MELNYKPMFIYGLYSSENENIIKYVGKTKCSLNKRLNEHLNGALKRNCKTYKDNWIRKVYKDGYIVNIKLLEECNNNIWEEREKYWITKINDCTNIAPGGEGGHGNLYEVSYDEMKKYILSLPFEINSKNDFLKIADIIDEKYPKYPYEHFSLTNEWVSWGDFLSTGRIQDNKNAKKYFSYNKAKLFLRKKKIRYMKDYHKFIKEEKIDFLPYRADRYYLGKGWKSWMDYLGTMKPYEITKELLKRYMNKYFPEIDSNYKLTKRFGEINNSIRYKYFNSFKWND